MPPGCRDARTRLDVAPHALQPPRRDGNEERRERHGAGRDGKRQKRAAAQEAELDIDRLADAQEEVEVDDATGGDEEQLVDGIAGGDTRERRAPNDRDEHEQRHERPEVRREEPFSATPTA